MKCFYRLFFILAFLSVVLSVSAIGKDTKGWILRCNDYNCDYTGAPVANGCIGILPWREPFSVRHVILNHIFELNDDAGVNCVLEGINPFNLVMSVDGQKVDGKGISNWNQHINMREATHNTSFIALNKVKVSYSIAALRNMPYSAIINIKLTALQDVDIAFNNTMSVPNGEYRNLRHLYKSYNAGYKHVDILQTNAETLHGRYDESASSMFIFNKGKFDYQCADKENAQVKVKLSANQSADLSLVASICTTHDFTDPYSESEREVIYVAHQTVESVMAAHRHCWDELWKGDIEIDGDDEAQQVVRFALYNLYSFCRKGSALSISPMGLSSRGYNGHIFWDAETWMFPPMLMMNADIARSMIDYRTNRLSAAKTRASVCGYQGAMFPWESDDFGQESTPTFAVTGQFEQHITADIAIACWNYYCMTHDREWLINKGWPLIKAVAEFWISRVERNSDGSYSIKGVVGADEYAEGVNDNAFTNGAAISALRCAVKASKALGKVAPNKWSEVANKIRILHDSKTGVTMEYEGYDGRTIKQGDVNLLGYPLGIITDRKQLLADLQYYDSKIDKNGPAMTYGIFCIQYARLGDAKKAEEMFRRCYRPNMRPPYGVFAETASSHNPYFATGAGGMLQAVIYGFGGLDITDNGIVQHRTVLPPSWKKLIIKGVGTDGKTYIVNNTQTGNK
jgi:trehalose/maltose hydrolase-like predicted phosphorylase